MHKKVIFFDLYQTLLDVRISSEDPEERKREVLRNWETMADLLEGYGVKVAGADLLELFKKRKEQFYSDGRDEKYYHHDYGKIVSQILKEDLNANLSREEILSLVYENRKLNRDGSVCIPEYSKC